jgi:phosphoribosylamine--glycine ligase
VLLAAADGSLADLPALEWSSEAAVTVVLAAKGYPAAPRTGDLLGGLDAAAEVPGAVVLHAGTAPADGGVVSAGGRVLSVVGTGPSVDAARRTAYEAIGRVTLDGGHYRRDIAASAGSPT